MHDSAIMAMLKPGRDLVKVLPNCSFRDASSLRLEMLDHFLQIAGICELQDDDELVS
jgi:hypothetical protein